MIKYFFVFLYLLFFPKLLIAQSLIDESFFDNITKPYIYDDKGQQKHLRNNDYYIFAPSEKPLGYYVGYANYKKGFLTYGGSKGEVFFYSGLNSSKAKSYEYKCLITTNMKSETNGTVKVTCPRGYEVQNETYKVSDTNKYIFKGSYNQNGNVGNGSVYNTEGYTREINFNFYGSLNPAYLDRNNFLLNTMLEDSKYHNKIEKLCKLNQIKKYEQCRNKKYLKPNKKSETSNNLKNEWFFCQNKYDQTLLSKRYARCQSSEIQISEKEYNIFKFRKAQDNQISFKNNEKQTNNFICVTPEGEIEFETKKPFCSSGLLQVNSEFYSKGKISKKLEVKFCSRYRNWIHNSNNKLASYKLITNKSCFSSVSKEIARELFCQDVSTGFLDPKYEDEARRLEKLFCNVSESLEEPKVYDPNNLEESRICLRKNGEVYIIPFEAGCGFNKEITPEEYMDLTGKKQKNIGVLEPISKPDF